MDAGEIKGKLKEIRETLRKTEKAIKTLKRHVERLRQAKLKEKPRRSS
jgi:hypothetical protein